MRSGSDMVSEVRAVRQSADGFVTITHVVTHGPSLELLFAIKDDQSLPRLGSIRRRRSVLLLDGRATCKDTTQQSDDDPTDPASRNSHAQTTSESPRPVKGRQLHNARYVEL